MNIMCTQDKRVPTFTSFSSPSRQRFLRAYKCLIYRKRYYRCFFVNICLLKFCRGYKSIKIIFEINIQRNMQCTLGMVYLWSYATCLIPFIAVVKTTRPALMIVVTIANSLCLGFIQLSQTTSSSSAVSALRFAGSGAPRSHQYGQRTCYHGFGRYCSVNKRVIHLVSRDN